MSGETMAAREAGGMAGAPARDWAGFPAVALAAAALLFGALVLALVVVDPYDTGRPGIVRAHGVHDQYPFTANASRARDPGFDAAIFGNSHVQMLNPERLDALTGLAFTSLIMPATWPTDQMRVLAWMVQARDAPPRALVFGIDHFWCLDHLARSPNFPDWLYSTGFPRYLAGLVRYRSLEAAAARLRVLATGRGAARRDGFWDYTPEYARRGLADRARSQAKLAEPLPFPGNASGAYPGLAAFREALAALAPSTAVVLLRPPVYRTGLPQPGSADAALSARCGGEIAEVAASRPRTAVVDLFRPGPLSEDTDDYYDHRHYRERVAAEVERALAAALRPLLDREAAGPASN